MTHSLSPGPQVAKTDSLPKRPVSGFRCPSDTLFAFSVSFVWLALYNTRFWHETVHAMWHGTFRSALFMLSLAFVVWCLQALMLLLAPSRRFMVATASALFVVAAAGSYFSMKYGTVMDRDMLRNVFETDTAELHSLLGAALMERTVVLGLVPAVLLWRVSLPAVTWSKRLQQQAVLTVVTLAACAIALLSCSASYAVFFREHKPIRFTLLPAAPLASALRVAFDKRKGDGRPLANASGPTQRTTTPHPKPLAIVMVVGETARAANFALGGYPRHTNPELSETDGLVYFPETTSCGTSTAISVPCMFSHLPRASFKVDAASGYANLLDALRESGLDVEWRDNNAGCKGVCARVQTVLLHPDADPRLCRAAYCYDEILLQDLPEKLETLDRDTVIVMHQIGSHGPAYFERYPTAFERFRPACRSSQLERCTADEVRNAYDNTIAYTDYVIARIIRMLRNASGHVDGMLMYASDHGESLGEQGMYLHGLPYAFAPDVQTHVPMLLWLSPEYLARSEVDPKCLTAHASEPRSHDNIYHTLLGAAEVRNASYDASLDVLANCRQPRWPHDHE